jgi:hypothetical protein
MRSSASLQHLQSRIAEAEEAVEVEVEAETEVFNINLTRANFL